MLPRLLIDERFRVQLVAHHVTDPFIRSFWLNEYAGYSDSFRTEAISPIQNKIGKVLIEPRLRNMLAQPKSTVTFRRLMDDGHGTAPPLREWLDEPSRQAIVAYLKNY